MLSGNFHTEESYLLIHNCGFSYSDVLQMTYVERASYIKLRIEESEREKKEMENATSK
jgi:hypothetical protein